MADIERVTIDELDMADVTQDTDRLIVETADGKVKSVTKKNLINDETQARITEDAALQLQINTMAGVFAGNSEGAPSYRVVEKMDMALKGANNGVAELDENGKIPMSQIPGGADDVRPAYGDVAFDEFGNVTDIQVYEDAEHTVPATPEAHIVYLDIGETRSKNFQYMWSGNGWARLGSSLVIGESASNAYRGDRGKIAYDHSQLRGTGTESETNPHGLSKADIGLGNVPNVTTDNQTPTITEASELENFSEGDTLKVIIGKIKKAISSLMAHITNKNNPHEVTKSQVGLGDVENYGRSTAVASGDDKYVTSGAVYSAFSDLDTKKQSKTMSSPVSIDGISETTVEGAVSTLAGKVFDTVKTVQTLPVSPDIQTRIYKCNGRYYIGDGTAQTLTELSVVTDIPDVIKYVEELPEENIKNIIYSNEDGFYAGNESEGVLKKIGGSDGTVAYFDTETECEQALLIEKGKEGYIPDGALVVIGERNNMLVGVNRIVHSVELLYFNGVYYKKDKGYNGYINNILYDVQWVYKLPDGAINAEFSHDEQPWTNANGLTRMATAYTATYSKDCWIPEDSENPTVDEAQNEDGSGVGASGIANDTYHGDKIHLYKARVTYFTEE